MTPHERADLVVRYWIDKEPEVHQMKYYVIAQIEEAEREAVAKVPVNAYLEGYARAKEQAAKIADNCEKAWELYLMDGTMEDQKDFIAKQIRAMQPENK